MRHPEELMAKVLTSPNRRAFFRYWSDFAKNPHVARCEMMLSEIEAIDRVVGPTLYLDTEEF